MTTIEAAALDFYRAREARKTAKNALLEYRQQVGDCEARDSEARQPPCYYSDASREDDEWCNVCEGAQPLWEFYRKASARSGASMRRLLLLCKKEATI